MGRDYTCHATVWKWILEDFDVGLEEIPFVDFGKVEWFDYEAFARLTGSIGGG